MYAPPIHSLHRAWIAQAMPSVGGTMTNKQCLPLEICEEHRARLNGRGNGPPIHRILHTRRPVCACVRTDRLLVWVCAQPHDRIERTSDCVAKRMAFGLVFVRISTQAVVAEWSEVQKKEKENRYGKFYGEWINNWNRRFEWFLWFIVFAFGRFVELVAIECNLCSINWTKKWEINREKERDSNEWGKKQKQERKKKNRRKT